MIIIASYSNVSVTYTADGTQTVFSFPFDYLRKAFVKVESDGNALEQGTDFSVYEKTVVFTEAPAEGTTLRIFRETETIPLVSWADASVLRAKDMTIQQIQVLHILEEYKGQYNDDLANMLIIAGVVTDSGELQHIVNQLNLIDSNTALVIDAVGEVNQAKEDAQASATSASDSALSATNSASSASDSATQAENLYEALIAQGGHPFQAATIADMTDITKIYVYVGNEAGYINGNWYYYNGNAWVSGGVYNATAFETDKTLSISGAAADAQVVGDKTNYLNSALLGVSNGYFPIESVAISNKYIDQDNGKLITYSGWTATDFISCDGEKNLFITATKSSNYGAFYSSNNENTRVARLSVSVGDNIKEVPETAKYFRLSNTTADMLSTKVSLMSISNIQEVKNALDVINSGEKDIGGYVSFEYVDNMSGSFVASTSYKRTHYISIADYIDGVIYFRSNVRTPYCCFYDANHNKIVSFIIYVGETLVRIPTNAVYCAFSYSRFNNDKVTMYDSTYSHLKSLGIDGISDVNLKYLDRTDILTQLIGKHMILVYTDIHGYPINFNRIGRFYENNLKDNVAFPICLGDMVRDQATDDITFMDTDFGNASLKVIGNHDVLAESTLPGITALETYNRYIAPSVANWGVVQPTGAAEHGYTYYYKDVSRSSGTIRFIVLDEYFYDEAQHNWFVATLTDANTNGYSVIVCQHQSNVWNNQATPLNDKWAFATPKMGFDLYRYDAGYAGDYATAAENRIMAVDDFIGNGGKFICWMSGHTHSDQCHTFERAHGKQLSLVFSNAGMSMMSSMRVSDYSCDCFQYVAVDLSNQYVYVLRIGEAVDKWLHKNEFMLYDYANHSVVEYH